MNRSTLKSAGFALLGVAVGWATGSPPWRGGGAGTDDGRLPRITGKGAPGAPHDGGPAGSGGKSSIGEPGGKPSRERLEMLAAKFQDRGKDQGETARMGLMMDIAELPAEEIGPVLEVLLAEKDINWEVAESLVIRWGMLDPRAALDFAAGREGLCDNVKIMAPVVQELAKADLPAARAALNRLGETGRGTVEMAVVRLLIRKDPRAALDYARELGNEEAETEALSSMAEKDPLAATAELRSGSEDQKWVVVEIADALLAKDRTAFEEWAEGLKDPNYKAVARLRVLAKEATDDPKGAALSVAAWLARDADSVAEVGNLPKLIVSGWTDADGPPAEVAAWAAALPEGQFREKAVEEAGRAWLERDIMAASAWVEALPRGDGRDRVVYGLVSKINGDTPADAFEWTRAIGNPSLRYEAQVLTLSDWATKDSAAARAAAETLPDGDRGYLMDFLQDMEKAKSKE